MEPAAQPLTLQVDAATTVSALLLAPSDATAGYVFAHGAGAGMAHAFMEAVARGLAQRRIATLRYQFAYMERGSKRPDAPPLAHAAVRAAVAAADVQWPHLPLVAGGKSFGGRMTSQAQALVPLEGVHGLVFFGFPLHPAGKPSSDRAKHLFDVRVPMLFLQGTRDELAEADRVRALQRELGAGATLEMVDDADHSFHVPARSGRKDAEVREALLDTMARWVGALPRA